MTLDVISRDAEPANILVLLPPIQMVEQALTERFRCAFEHHIHDMDAFLQENAHTVRALVVDGSRATDRYLLDALSSLGLIACVGTGYEAVDMDLARARGIIVTHGRGVNCEDVADLAIGLCLSAIRGIAKGDRMVRSGSWHGLGGFPRSLSMRELRFGIVGLGQIGSAVATRLAAFSSRIRWWGPSAKNGVDLPRAEGLLELARSSDVLIVTARADPGNIHLIGNEVLNALGPSGFLVNVGRGSLIDEPALREALRSGSIAGAAVDVFDEEPTQSANWSGLENVTMTPHIGGWTTRSMLDATSLLVDNIERFFNNTPFPALWFPP
jgi:lactate dehydrogenase-like 2-hydroxyacid dehydrogenase